MRSLLLAFCVFCCPLFVAPARATEWSTIDCGQSKLQVLPGAKCEVTDSSGTGSKSSGANRIVTKSYSTRGTHEGVVFNISLHKPESIGTFMNPSTTDQRKSSMQTFNSVTKEGTNWSEPERLGSALYMTFDRTRQKCFAFHDVGPTKGDGYAYTVWGFFCRTQPQSMSNVDARDLLAKISVR